MRFFRRRTWREQELEEEIQAHLAIEAKQRIESGQAPEEAERAARRDFGNVGMVKEVTRQMWGSNWVESSAQDLRRAVRLLRKTPGFTAVAILTLALGIGANTVIFSMVYAALLRPLPFPDPDRVVRILATKNGQPIGAPSPMDIHDFSVSAKSFESVVAYDRWRKNVSGIAGSEDAEETIVGLVPGAYFRLLGIKPILGRPFTEQESTYGKHYVAAISSSFWQTRFHADPQILGKTLRINGEMYAIIAVIPDVIPGWMDQTSAPISIWTPFAFQITSSETARGDRGEYALARLKRRVSYEAARRELSALAARLSKEHPLDQGIGVAIEPLTDARAGPVRPILLLLSGGVGIVLIIACANLASLLIARNSARSRELAVRAALGAVRSRLLRQLLLETLALSVAGALAGLALASAASFALTRMKPAGNIPYTIASNALPQFWSASAEPRVLLFTLAVSILTAMLFGLAPAFTGARAPLADVLREAGRSGTAAMARQRFRRMLVTTEVALSLILVFAATLLFETLGRLEQQDPGFPTGHLLIAHVYLPPARYPDAAAITRFCDAFAERVRALPGVRDASMTTGYPPSFRWAQMFTIPGSPAPRISDIPTAQFAGVDDRYLHTLGLRLVNGRDLSQSDTAASVPVAVVNQEFVRRYFPNQDPIGRQIRPGPPPGVPPGPFSNFGASTRNITIAGVVRNFINDGMALPPAPHIFILFRQFPGLNYGFKDILVRTAGNPQSFVPAIARELKSLDADIPLGEVQSMEQHIATQTSDTRFTSVLLGLFAGLGIVLALIGAYGVVAYLVAQRTQELGVRLALGADSRDILWLILRYGLSIGLVGIALGLGGSILVRQSLARLLYGVAVSDPWTLAGSAILMLIVVVIASAVPAASAMRIDPVRALRCE
jgi:putative ABC transport system permease protein